MSEHAADGFPASNGTDNASVTEGATATVAPAAAPESSAAPGQEVPAVANPAPQAVKVDSAGDTASQPSSVPAAAPTSASEQPPSAPVTGAVESELPAATAPAPASDAEVAPPTGPAAPLSAPAEEPPALSDQAQAPAVETQTASANGILQADDDAAGSAAGKDTAVNVPAAPVTNGSEKIVSTASTSEESAEVKAEALDSAPKPTEPAAASIPSGSATDAKSEGGSLGRSRPAEATGMEPPVKKVRTEATAKAKHNLPMEMTAAQLKFAQSTIKSLKGRREAAAFLKPVDPIAQGVPHYPQIIAKPMDLGTIDIKLALTAPILKPNTKPGDKIKQAPEWGLDPAKDYYRNLAQFDADVRLVFTNCATFNGDDSIFTHSAKVLEAAHDKYMKDAPPSAPIAVAAAAAASPQAEARTRRPSNPVPTIRRSSSDANGRPKREIHPPPSKDLPWANEPQGASTSVIRKAASRKAASKAGNLSAREEAHIAKVALEEIKFCTRVIDDLLKPSYHSMAWVFYDLPEKDLDWSPAYYQMIKKPTALRVIQGNIRAGKYADAEEFDADMQLLFRNCFLFNQEDSDVHRMGQDLKKTYEDKMKRKPAPPPLLPDYDDSDEEDEDAEGDDEDVDPEFMARLSEQITGLQGTLAALEGAKNQNRELIDNTKQMLVSLQESYASSGTAKKPKQKASAGAKRKASGDAGSASKKKGKAKAASSPATSAAAAGASAEYAPSKKVKQQAQKKKNSPAKNAGAGSKRGAGSDDDIRAVTYEQKEELAAKITELSEERLDGAIRIINEDKPPGQNDEEEIELDIDELSAKTLYKLYKYVVRPNKKAAAAAAAASKNNGRSAPLDGRKRGTGGLKKKNLDEGEEAERIARLQQQLDQFGGNTDTGASAAAGTHDDLVHSESSSEGESGSESDSD